MKSETDEMPFNYNQIQLLFRYNTSSMQDFLGVEAGLALPEFSNFLFRESTYNDKYWKSEE